MFGQVQSHIYHIYIYCKKGIFHTIGVTQPEKENQ